MEMSSLPNNNGARPQPQQSSNGRGSSVGGRGFPQGGRSLPHQNPTPSPMFNNASRGGMVGSAMQPVRGVSYNHLPYPHHAGRQPSTLMGDRGRGMAVMGGIPPPPPPMQYGRGIPPPPPPPPHARRGSGPYPPLQRVPPPFYPQMGAPQPHSYNHPQGSMRYPPPLPLGVVPQLHPPPPPPPPILPTRHPGSFPPPNPTPARGASAQRGPPPPHHLPPPPLHHPTLANSVNPVPMPTHARVSAQDPRQEFRGPPVQSSTHVNNHSLNISFPRASDSQVLATSTPVPIPVYTQEQLEQAWTEFKPPDGGAVYYYNSLTSKSQWDKPASIQRRETAATSREAQEAPQETWKEYSDANTGKKYYSNGTTTTWNKPDHLNDESQSGALVEPSSEPPRKKKKTIKTEAIYSNKEECIAAYKGLLLAKEVTPSMKWNDVVKLCSPDSRWESFEDVLSIGERKQCLAEYQTKRTNELRDIERQEKARSKDAFLRLLNDTLPTLSGFSPWTSRFDEIRESLSRDDRFHAVTTDGIRESLFFDFCEESKKREERKKRNKRKEAHDNLLDFFKLKEEDGLLSFASTWASFYASLSSEDRGDPRLATSVAMTDADRQLYFADYVIELQSAEDDKRNRMRVARRRAEQAQREAYEGALKDLAANGKIMPSARWRSVESLISSLPCYGPVCDQDREAPREIFEDFVAEWNEAYRWDRSVLNQLVYPESNQQLVFPDGTSYDEFTKSVLQAAASASPDLVSQVRRIISRSDPVSSAHVYLQELLQNNSSGQRRGSSQRRVTGDESSSEDEGEIVEE